MMLAHVIMPIVFDMPNPTNKNTFESVKEKFHTLYTLAERGYKTPCWEWNKTDQTTGGYGIITILGKKYKAHRLSWMLFVGEIPEGMLVCHHCDNPPCANHEHFFIGTKADNNRDSESKGRNSHCIKGEAHPLAKLTENDVRFIRANPRAGHKNLARHFGVQKSLIARILKGVSWPHVQ